MRHLPAWAVYLDGDDVAEMRRELDALSLADDVSGFIEAFDAWKATAMVLADPALAARLLAPDDPAQEVPLARP